jgi:lipopolysaccharide transport system permease protein
MMVDFSKFGPSLERCQHLSKLTGGLSSLLRLLLYLLIIWLGFVGAPPLTLFASTQYQTPPPELVTQTFHYHLLEAGEVYLVWGVDDWQLVPEEARPLGTVVESGVMHTPMTLLGEDFTVRLQLPVGTTLNYGFQTRSTREGAAIEWVWDGDYELVLTKNTTVEVDGSVEINPVPTPAAVQAALPVIQEFRYALPEAGEVYLVWGVNGWQPVPLEAQPAGTLLDADVMYTPMQRVRDTFVAKIRVTAGTIVDYGFQIRAKRDSIAIERVWQGDYQLVATQNDVVEVAGAVSLAETNGIVSDVQIGPYLLLGVILLWIIAWLVTGRLQSEQRVRLPRSLIAIIAISISLYLLLLLIRAHILGFKWVSGQMTLDFLPTLFTAGYQDLLYVSILSLFGLCFAWLLRGREKAQRFLISLYFSFALFSLFLGFLNIYFVRLFDNLPTLRQIYAADFWGSIDPGQVVLANLSPGMLLNLASLSVALLVIASLLGDGIFRLLKHVDHRLFLVVMLLLLGLYIPLTRWYIQPSEREAIRVVNPVMALLASWPTTRTHSTLGSVEPAVQVPDTLSLQPSSSSPATDQQFLLYLVLSVGLFAGATVMVSRTPTLSLPPFGQRLIYLHDLLQTLVSRDFKLRYKRSLLGIAWSLLNPLAQLLVFYFIFSQVLSLGIPNYAAFLSTGILVWSWFQQGLLSATGAIVDNPGLIRRPGFPAAILPVVAVMAQLTHFLLALPILLLFLGLSGLPLTVAMLALPFVMALQFLLTLSLSYVFATIHVYFRDMQYLLGILLLLGFYLSPIFYDPSTVPAHYQWLYRLNPMVPLINAYRQILLQGHFPNVAQLVPLGVAALALLWVGHWVFVRASHRFVEEL